ncbi:MAG: hypothetical protein U0K78_01800, partial [Agathobacter sp.]|nr:hypothetical protein [Agathobacter sp.]
MVVDLSATTKNQKTYTLYLTNSIDLGLHNLMTCYDSAGTSFILGRKYLEISRKDDKDIARLGHQWTSCQSAGGIKYPKPSR